MITADGPEILVIIEFKSPGMVTSLPAVISKSSMSFPCLI